MPTPAITPELIPFLARVEWTTYGSRKTGTCLSGLDGHYERDSAGRVRYDVAQDDVHPHRNRWDIGEGNLRLIERS